MSHFHGSIRYITLTGMLLSCQLFTLGASADESAVQVSSGWVRETPPSVRNAAAFLTLANTANADRQLLAVQCSAALAARCEIHEHLHSESGMRMQKVSQPLLIKGNSRLDFKPGGYHVMLLDIASPLRKGSTIELTLIFNDQTTVTAQLPVKPLKEE